MNSTNRFSLFAIVTIFVLVLSLLTPAIAFADDGTPPAPTEEPVQPPTEEPVEETAPAQEESTAAEVLEELPADTELVVINEEGEVLSLTTEEAAEIIVAGDPMWCPGLYGEPGATLPGGAGCTSSFTSFTNLITELGDFDSNEVGAGTIYIASNYDATANSDTGTNVIFDYGANELTDLVFQGGWDFGANDVVGTSTLTGITSLQFWDWGSFGFPGSLTVNDIIMSGGDGLYIGSDSGTPTANVVLNNITVNNTNLGTYVETDGTVSIIDSTFNDNDSNGLEISSGGDISLNDVTASRNNDDGAYLDNSGGSGDVTLTGTNEFNNNDEYGLNVLSGDDIHLNNVTANRNGEDGAYLETCGCTGDSDIVLTGTNEFNDNAVSGLYAGTDGDIQINNITASGNGEDGAYLGGSGDLDLTGTNVFNNNDAVGLYIEMGGDVTLNNVTAYYNYYNGAWVDNTYGTGDVSIYNSNFDYNVEDPTDGDAGLDVDSYGHVTLSNVSASNNGGDGSDIGDFSSLLIQNSTFNNNYSYDDDWGYGLYIYGGNGDVSLVNVEASGNSTTGIDPTDGVYIETTGNATIICSKFKDNASGYGVYGDDVDGTLTLNDVTFSNNGLGDYSGTAVLATGGCLPEGGGKGKPAGAGLPLHLVPVNDVGTPVELDCELFSGTVLILGNGDSVTFKCPTTGSATLTPLTNDGLPGDLPEGMEYVSGVNTTQSPAGSDKALEGLVIASFIIPEDLKSSDFAILYWDGSQWVDLKDGKFDDDRKVFNGGSFGSDGDFEAITNFSGNFVLVTK